jgi:hypothetical protein
MSAKNTSRTVLIREITLLPKDFVLEMEPFVPGWKIVLGIDAYGLGRKLEEAHWNFFYLASETKVIVFGREKPGTLRRAARQIIAKHKGQKCNSLEITSAASKSFLGIPFLHVAAHSRHIQESLFLMPGTESAARTPFAATQGLELESKERQRVVEVHNPKSAAQIYFKSSTEIRK